MIEEYIKEWRKNYPACFTSNDEKIKEHKELRIRNILAESLEYLDSEGILASDEQSYHQYISDDPASDEQYHNVLSVNIMVDLLFLKKLLQTNQLIKAREILDKIIERCG